MAVKLKGLQKLQEALCLGNGLKAAHIQWHEQKMKLSIQVLQVH